MKAAVVKETAPGERRVALVPDAVARLRPAGIEVLVESGAGEGAWLSDAVYADAGASIVSTAELYRTADVVSDRHQAFGRGGERAQEGPGGHRHAGPADQP